MEHSFAIEDPIRFSPPNCCAKDAIFVFCLFLCIYVQGFNRHSTQCERAVPVWLPLRHSNEICEDKARRKGIQGYYSKFELRSML